MPAAQETVPVFIEIRKWNWSNPATGIQVLDENNTTVDAGLLLFGDPRTGTSTEVAESYGNF